MSYDAIRWAMAQAVPKASAKFVLVAMADCVNADGGNMTCWPSQAHLARVTSLDIKTVEAGMRLLRGQGLIVDTEQRRGETGRVRVYRLNTSAIGGVSSGPQGQATPPESGANDPGSGGIQAQVNTPGIPVNAPVFPAQSPRFSGETPPKTGAGTRKGTSNGTKKESGRGEHAHAIPGVPDQLVTDWIAVRKAKKAGPLTATAIAGLLREATKAGITPEAAVTFCCEAGWQGFNAGWYGDRTKGRTPTPSSKHSGFAEKDYREGVEADGSFH